MSKNSKVSFGVKLKYIFLGISLSYLLSTFFIFAILKVYMRTLEGGANDEGSKASKNKVLLIKLEGDISKDLDDIDLLGGNARPGLTQYLEALEKAEKDEKIRGVFLSVGAYSTGWASTQTLRQALKRFKEKSGKAVFAYGHSFNEKTYYLSSVADSIALPNLGQLEINGLGLTPMYVKGLMRKLSLKPVIFKAGKYKSAVEMFTRENMGAANRHQLNALINDIWNEVSSEIAMARPKVDKKMIESTTSKMAFLSSQKALDLGYIDSIKEENQSRRFFESQLMAKMTKDGEKAATQGASDQKDREKKEDLEEAIDFVGVEKYLELRPDFQEIINQIVYKRNLSTDTESPTIGVLNIFGEIRMGKGSKNATGLDTVLAHLRDIKERKNIKGLILRINSPGGSALASDSIYREIKNLKIPVYALFEDIAASGGYYIGAAAKKIYVQPSTITGSIGVFGMFFETATFMRNKLGLSFDVVKTHAYGDFPNPNRSLSSAEKHYLNSSLGHTYNEFLKVVQDSRKFSSLTAARKLAEGRVWSGKEALKNNLADKQGSFLVALEDLAQELGLARDEYETVQYMHYRLNWKGLLTSRKVMWPFRFFADFLSSETWEGIKTPFETMALLPYHFSID